MKKVIISSDAEKEVDINNINETKCYAFHHKNYGRCFFMRKQYKSTTDFNNTEDNKYVCITPRYLTIGDKISFPDGIGRTLDSAIKYIMNELKFQVYEFNYAQEMFKWLSEG